MEHGPWQPRPSWPAHRKPRRKRTVILFAATAGLAIGVITVSARSGSQSDPAAGAPAAAAAAASPASAADQQVRAAGCASGWLVQQEGASAGTLAALSAVTGTDAWAVGSKGIAARTLAERWNGTRWVPVPTPSPDGTFDLLSGVTAISASDAWAVGGQGLMSGSTAKTLTERWNGISWQAVPSPSPSAAGNELYGVAALSPVSVWAVGGDDVTSASGPAQTLVLRWNGTSWSRVATPDPGTYNVLDGVARIPGTSRLWAVGAQTTGSRSTPLIVSWNGVRWITVPAPAVAMGALQGVAALGPGDAWAVGYAGTVPLVLHWNGTLWSRVRLPAAAGALVSVAARSATDAWAVGDGLIMHWNGTSWSAVRWPRPSQAYLSGTAVVATPSGWTAWAVGSWGARGQPLVLTRCG